MDEEIDSIFRNLTEDDYDGYSGSFHTYFFQYLEILIGIVGITLDVLVVLVFWRNKTMQTRTNLLIANCFVIDIFFLLFRIFLDGYIIDAGDFAGKTGCLMLHSEAIAELAMVLLTLLLLSNKAVKTKELTTVGILTCTYLIVAVYYVSLVIQCIYITSAPFVVQGLTILVICLGLTVTTIAKDVNRCRRKSSVPLSDDSNYRLNFAKILTYNWLAAFVFLHLLEVDAIIYFKLISISLYLTSTYRFVYVFVADVKFKMCLLHLLSCHLKTAEDLGDTENLVIESETIANKDNSIVVNLNAPNANAGQ